MRRAKLGTLVIVILQIAVAASVGGQAIGTHPDFDLTAAEEEAYWYSRYNLGHLTMRAGMGETFTPDPGMVERMIAIVDADPEDGDTVSPSVNPALLRTVYAAGDPHWLQTADPTDFATLRWDPESFDTRITGSALGWTLIKELEWAKQFHIDGHFGTPEDDFGAQWRFMGLVLTAMAKEQALAWMELNAAGEMVMIDAADPFVMLMAISAGLSAVVNEGGTGWRARLKDHEVCGKTGSAQVVTRTRLTEDAPEKLQPHAWFIGYAPADEPRIAFAFLVEHGKSGGQSAAPLARAVLTAFFAEDQPVSARSGG